MQRNLVLRGGRRFNHCLILKFTPMDDKLSRFLKFAAQHVVATDPRTKQIVNDIRLTVPEEKLAFLVSRFRLTENVSGEGFKNKLINSLRTLEDPLRAIMPEPLYLSLGKLRAIQPTGSAASLNECSTLVVHPKPGEAAQKLYKLFDTAMNGLREKEVVHSNRRGLKPALLAASGLVKGRKWDHVNLGDILSHQGMEEFLPPGAGPIDHNTLFTRDDATDHCPEVDLGTVKVTNLMLKQINGWGERESEPLYSIDF